MLSLSMQYKTQLEVHENQDYIQKSLINQLIKLIFNFDEILKTGNPRRLLGPTYTIIRILRVVKAHVIKPCKLCAIVALCT